MMRRAFVFTSCLFVFATGLTLIRAESQNLSTSVTYREAYDQGYADGLSAGQEDRQDQRAFDYANKRSFQRADHGYAASRHEREIYRVAYRRGFEDGYEDGYELESKSSIYSVDPPSPPSSSHPDDSEPSERTKTSEIRDVPEGGIRISPGTRLTVKLLDTLSTRRNSPGDSFRAEVMQDVRVGRRIAISKGTRISGTIASLKRAGRIKGRSEMSLDFQMLELSDGSKVPVEASVVSIERTHAGDVREDDGTIRGEATKGEDAKKITTSSAIGALIGLVAGGKRGTTRGAAVGAVTGMAGVLMTRGQDLQLRSESELLIELDQEVIVPSR